jgi:phosphatidylserine/phosphatidylglycerophosphate/cardiolipin synthase-like enzyme
VSIDAALETVLERLSDAQVSALAARCEPRTTPPSNLSQAVTGASLGTHTAVKDLAAAWSATQDLTGSGVALALRSALRARQDAALRRSSPVWTGPCAVGEQRLTASVLHQLIEDATERVLLVSYAAYTLQAVADDLAAAVQRGCAVDVVFETTEDSAGKYDGPGSAAFAHVTGIKRWRWPADKRDVGAALHAKLLVIDGRQALVGSANLTHRALTANLESGVLLRDPDVAASLEAHVRDLMNAGVLIPG